MNDSLKPQKQRVIFIEIFLNTTLRLVQATCLCKSFHLYKVYFGFSEHNREKYYLL